MTIETYNQNRGIPMGAQSLASGGGGGTGGASINDNQVSTTTVYSSSKVESRLAEKTGAGLSLGFNATLANETLTFVTTDATPYTLKENYDYEVDLHFPAAGTLSDTIKMVVENNNDTIQFVALTHADPSEPITVGTMKQLMYYDAETGFRWLFKARYKITSTGVKVFVIYPVIAKSESSGAPANMVTTDTSQTITGSKSFRSADKNTVYSLNVSTNVNSTGLNDYNAVRIQAGPNTAANINYGSSLAVRVENRQSYGNGYMSWASYEADGIRAGCSASSNTFTIQKGAGNTGGSFVVTGFPSVILNPAKTYTGELYPLSLFIPEHTSNTVSSTPSSYGVRLSCSRSGANRYAALSATNAADLEIKSNGPNGVIFPQLPKYSKGTSTGATSAQRTFENLLCYSNVTAGDGISIEKTTGNNAGIKISATSAASTTSDNGIRGDYASTYGILDAPNGIITSAISDGAVVLTLHQGLVMQCAGQEAKTTISADTTHTVESTTDFDLFYASGSFYEAAEVVFSETEPTGSNTGITAWFNPNKTANPSQKWQFKSNTNGNTWASSAATRLAHIHIEGTNITRIDYAGCRVLDNQTFLTEQKASAASVPHRSARVAVPLTASGEIVTMPATGELRIRGGSGNSVNNYITIDLNPTNSDKWSKKVCRAPITNATVSADALVYEGQAVQIDYTATEVQAYVYLLLGDARAQGYDD